MRFIKPKYRNLAGCLFCAIFLAAISNNAQVKQLTEEEKIFRQVEDGVANSSVDKFSSYFLDKIFISLSTGTPKYYSADQAYYVIKNFLGIHNPTGFKFDFQSTGTQNPFASGDLKYSKNGIKGKAKIYITLTYEKNQWKISQITIN
jgi:hypothetical protein